MITTDVAPSGVGGAMPDLAYFNAGLNADIKAGDLVAVRVVGGVQSLRVFTAASQIGIAGNGADNGVMGIAACSVRTDASGNPLPVIPAGQQGTAYPVFSMPSVMARFKPDADGYILVPVWLASENNLFKVRYGPTASNVCDSNLIGRSAGPVAGGGAWSSYFFADEQSTRPIWTIVDVDRTDPNFNTACDGDTSPFTTCTIMVKFRAQHSQWVQPTNNGPYTS